MKKYVWAMLIVALLVSMTACGAGGSAVPVQRADQLTLAGQAEERYAGMVVNEDVVEITRDSSKKVAEL